MKKTMTVIVALTVLLAAWHWWPQGEDGGIAKQLPDALSKTAATAARRSAAAPSWPPPFPEQKQDLHYVPLLPTGPQESATQSLAATRNGDPRTPPIAHSISPSDSPSAADLADPKAYQRFEAGQNQRLYAAYVQAADEELPRLRANIAKARELSLSDADIAKGEDKFRRIDAMRTQLLNEHPELKH